MKVGNTRVHREPNSQIWKIQGRRGMIWYDTTDDGKDLTFDLKYDACAYLQSIVEEYDDERIMQKTFINTKKQNYTMFEQNNQQSIKERKNKQKKRKISRESKRRNRKK